MQLTDIRAALGGYAARFEPSAVSMSDAHLVLAEAARIERIAAGVKAQAAARVAASGSWRERGARSAADDLARQTGTTVGQARDTLTTGEQLEGLPEVRDAAARGDLSAEQTAAIADAASHAPDQAARLVEKARSSSLPELRDECAKTKAAATGDDAEARRRRIHAARSLKHWTDKTGTGHLHARGNPEDLAKMIAALGPARETAFTAARQAGTPVPPEALDYDALLTTLTQTPDPAMPGTALVPRPSRTKILCRVDLDTLLRGYPTTGETCEIVGYGPVAVSAITDLIRAGGFLAAIITKGKQVHGVAHLGRAPTAHQNSALEWLNPTCAAEGCHRSVRLERDHRIPWAQSKITLLDWLDQLCDHEHDLKTHQNWSLIDGTGKRPFVPPTDPRHPDNARRERGLAG